MTTEADMEALRDAAAYGCEWMRAVVVATMEQAADSPETPAIGREILRRLADVVRAIEPAPHD